MLRIFIADDHRKVHDGLELLFRNEEDCSIVGHAFDGQSATEGIPPANPDVVFLDIRMPQLNGFDVARKLLTGGFSGKIIFLTQYEEEEYLRGAVELGAAGYLLKEHLQEAVTAVRAVSTGKPYFSPSGLAPIFRAQIEGAGEEDRESDMPSLTAREREFLGLMLEGNSLLEIGVKLKLSPRTVQFHAANIRQKFGLKHEDKIPRRVQPAKDRP